MVALEIKYKDLKETLDSLQSVSGQRYGKKYLIELVKALDHGSIRIVHPFSDVLISDRMGLKRYILSYDKFLNLDQLLPISKST